MYYDTCNSIENPTWFATELRLPTRSNFFLADVARTVEEVARTMKNVLSRKSNKIIIVIANNSYGRDYTRLHYILHICRVYCCTGQRMIMRDGEQEI